LLRIEGLSKTFHSTTEHAAVDNLSLEIPEKSFFTLLGPSGCGKTGSPILTSSIRICDN
jgi:ABC-type Fe3+/spermidine/putrescine transport system ATPase subunit